MSKNLSASGARRVPLKLIVSGIKIQYCVLCTILLVFKTSQLLLNMNSFNKKIKRWQKIRQLEIYKKNIFCCENCTSSCM